jgi:hypothetical protein
MSGYGLDDGGDQGSILRRGEMIFPLASVSRPTLGPSSLLFNGYPSPFPGPKARPGRHADHSPSIAEVEIG